MNYFDSESQKKNLSLSNSKLWTLLDREIYDKYLRENYSNHSNTKEYTDYEHLENIFSNEIYFRAMKDLSKNEKRLLCYIFLDNKTLNDVCKELRITKAETIELKKDAIEHFKLLVDKYSKLYSSNKGGDFNEE